MLRGWIGPSRYVSERKQREALLNAGVPEKAIYRGPNEWSAFVLSLRPEAKDKAVVADLRVFGSRRALVKAAEEVAKRGATLAAVEGLDLDLSTLWELDRVLRRWRGEAALGSRKRASQLGKRGAIAAKRAFAAQRLDEDAARMIWQDTRRYPNAVEALGSMPGWTRVTAWRRLGPREVKQKR